MRVCKSYPVFSYRAIILNMRRKIIFIGGIHGVGKTTLCRSLCAKFNIEHHSASELISKFKQVEFSSNKLTATIEGNQDALIMAIDEFLVKDAYYLLDGHFCLLDQNGKVIRIPLSTFTSMLPVAIILLYDDPIGIYSRLKERDKEKYDVALLASFQEEEASHSEKIARGLGVPFIKANPFMDSETISSFVVSLLDRGEHS